MFPVKTVYFSIVLCLFVWGFGWLAYEYMGLYDVLSPVTFQNVMIVTLGVSLSVVVWTGFGSEKGENAVKVKFGNPGVSSVAETRERLEAELWDTEPNSKERREILRKLDELER